MMNVIIVSKFLRTPRKLAFHDPKVAAIVDFWPEGFLYTSYCLSVLNVVMGQELAPTQAGTVSAMMMGFAWGTSGLLFIPLTGWISDLFSMQTAFTGLVLFPLIGFFLALKLPK